jgi:lysophospholipase L1-like esterase
MSLLVEHWTLLVNLTAAKVQPGNRRVLAVGDGLTAPSAAGLLALDVVNMYPVIGDQANFKTALLQDTWHPNEAGYKLMGAAWYQELAGLLP